MMTCEEIENKLSAWFDGELDGPEQRQVEQHLQTCSACRKKGQQLLALHTQGKHALADYHLPEAYWRDLTDRILSVVPARSAAAGPGLTGWFRRRRTVWVGSISLAAMIALVALTTDLAFRQKGIIPLSIDEDRTAAPAHGSSAAPVQETGHPPEQSKAKQAVQAEKKDKNSRRQADPARDVRIATTAGQPPAGKADNVTPVAAMAKGPADETLSAPVQDAHIATTAGLPPAGKAESALSIATADQGPANETLPAPAIGHAASEGLAVMQSNGAPLMNRYVDATPAYTSLAKKDRSKITQPFNEEERRLALQKLQGELLFIETLSTKDVAALSESERRLLNSRVVQTAALFYALVGSDRTDALAEKAAAFYQTHRRVLADSLGQACYEQRLQRLKLRF
ncbi:hypothetical protein GX408_20115 [bacterium]|nr:hypothetical protein [bacterium]